MNRKGRPSISELMSNPLLIEAALQKAGRAALREHALLGHSVPIAEDGKVVWIAPDEILRRLAEDEKSKGLPASGPANPAQSAS